VYYAAGEYTQELVLQMENNIKPDRADMDLLYGCLLDWGLPLSLPHTREKIDGFTVHTYNGGDLIACFEERVSEKTIREIAGRKPLRAVFRDSGFASSPEKINVFEIFKLLAPNTNVRVI
jgi:adenine-specific DNA-methyltransferase